MEALCSLASGVISMLSWLLLINNFFSSFDYFGVSIFSVRGFYSMIKDPWSPLPGCWKLCVWRQGLFIVGCTVDSPEGFGQFHWGTSNTNACTFFPFWLDTFYTEESLVILPSVD